MDIEIDLSKSIHENAAAYYEKAKKLKKKLKGLLKAVEETEKKIKELEEKKTKKKEKPLKRIRKKEWYHKFHWFFTSSGRLCIGGKNASQNEEIFKKYMKEGDLFFHVDIPGGSVVVLKDGEKAGGRDKKEAAQFAASFSRAWKMGYSSADVYSLKYSQLSKTSEGIQLPKGSIGLRGEREWFRNTPLRLRIGLDDDGFPAVLPDLSVKRLRKEILLIPGGKGKKAKVAQSIAHLLGVHVDEVLGILPNGQIAFRKL